MATLAVTKEDLAEVGLQQGPDGMWRAKLWTLWEWRWSNNPKVHAREKIAASIVEHGFNDSIGIDPWLQLVLEGHGRLDYLMGQYELEPTNPPQHVTVGEDNDWWVPVTPLKFDTRYAALRYALMHNTAGTVKTQKADYHIGKLKAAATEQMGLFDGLVDFNFDTTEAGADTATDQIVLEDLPEPTPQTPPTEIFDPGSLPDKPEATGVKAKMLWMSFETSEELNLALKLLSFGERKQGIGEDAFYASFPGKKYLERWKKILGAFIGLETPAGDEAVEDKRPEPTGPEWDAEGNCVECKGTGNAGHSTGIGGAHTLIYCTACGGWGTKEAFEHNQKVEADPELQEILDNQEVTGVEEG